MSKDRIVVEFDAETGKLIAGTAKVKQSIASVSKEVKAHEQAMAGVRNAVVGAAAAYLSVGAAIGVVSAAIDKYGRIQDKADQTGLSPEFLQELGNAAETCGGDVEQLATAASKLSKEIVFGGVADLSTKALNALGFSLQSLKDLSPDVIFTKIGLSIANIEDPIQRSAAAIAIFGKAGAALVPTFLELKKGIGDTSVLTRQQIADVDALGDTWTRWKQKATAAIATVVADLANGKIAANLSHINPGGIAGSGGAYAAQSMSPDSPSARAPGDYPSGHRGADKADFQKILKDKEAQAAMDEKIAARKKEIAAENQAYEKETQTLIDKGQKEEASRNEEIAQNEKDTAKIRHDAALDAMDDEHKLAALIQDRIDLLKKYTGTETALQKSEIDKEVAAKDAQIQALRNSISSGGSSSGGGEPLPPGTLASSAALDKFQNDPKNYDPVTGKMNAGALGRLRWLQRKATRDSAIEAHRQAYGFGSTPSPRQPASAESYADSTGFWKNPAINQKGVSTGKQFGPFLPDGMMGDGSKGGAGADGSKGGDPMSKLSDDVAAIRKVTEDRLPKKSTGKG